jgi:GxxExxY protein
MDERVFNPVQGTPQRLRQQELPDEYEQLAHRVIGLAMEVHRALGPGMLESLYSEAMAFELTEAKIPFVREVMIRVPYKGIILGDMRLDLVVDDRIIVELKSASDISDLFIAQTLGYLRAMDRPLGLLFNFNSVKLVDVTRRVFNARWSGLAGRSAGKPRGTP